MYVKSLFRFSSLSCFLHLHSPPCVLRMIWLFQARTHGLTTAECAWMTRTDGDLTSWDAWLTPGEKVILFTRQQQGPVESPCGTMVGFSCGSRFTTNSLLKIQDLLIWVLDFYYIFLNIEYISPQFHTKSCEIYTSTTHAIGKSSIYEKGQTQFR